MIDDRPLTTQIQEYVCEILNNDPDFKNWGIVFYPENALDIDFQIKNSMSKQGLACVVMTPTLNYQGHDALTQTFTLDDLTIQVVENTIINRARLKKEGKEFGTALDVASKASDILAGPQSGHYGEFTTKRIEQGEDGNLVVAKSVFGTTMYKQVEGIIEWDEEGHKVEIPFVTKEQIKNLEDEVEHLQDLVIGFDTEEIKTKVYELEQATERIEVEITSLADVYQPIGNYLTPDDLIPYALKTEVPTKVSQLENDSEYINKNQVDWDLINDKPDVALRNDIPTKTSELDNDAGFTKVRESTEFPGYAENARESIYSNQAVYAEVATTAMNVEWSSVSGKPNIPTKTSEIENDSGYLTTVSWNDIQNRPNVALVDDIPTNVSQLNNDAGYLTTVRWNDVQDKPYIVYRDYLDWRLEEYPTKVEMNNTIDEKISELVIPENTKLYSPSKNRYIQGDSSVWENRTTPGYWTDWEWSDGNDYTSGIVIYPFGEEGQEKYRAGIDQATYFTPEFDSEDEVQNYLNSQDRIEWTTISGPVETIISTRQWIEEKTEFVQVETLAYESQLPTKVSDLTNDAGYLTTISWNDIQNIPNVALQSDIPTRTSELINDSGFITTSPDFSLYYTKVECNDRFQPIGNYLTEHQSLENYYTIEQIQNGYQVKGNYLTEHQSLANYYTKQECDERFGSSSSIVKQLYSVNERRYIDGDGLVWKQEETGFWSDWEWSSGIQEDLECAYISDIDKWSFFLRSKAYYLLSNLWWNTQEEAEAWLDEQESLEFEKDGEFFITGTRHWHTSGYEWKYYDDLANKSDLPKKTSELTNDSGFITEVYWSDVQQKPDLVDETQLNRLRNDINSELNTKLNISDYDNTKLNSPTVEKFIDGDGKVWSNREGHWTDWEYSDGIDHGEPTIEASGSRWRIVVDIVYRTNEYSTRELAEEALNGNSLTFLYATETITANRTWIPEGLQQIDELAYKSDLGGIDDRFEEIESRTDGLSTTVDGISNRVETAESRIGQIEERVDGVEDSIEDVYGTVGDIQTSVAQIQTSVSQVQTDVQNVQAQVSTGQWIDLIGETEDGTTVTFQIFAKGI